MLNSCMDIMDHTVSQIQQVQQPSSANRNLCQQGVLKLADFGLAREFVDFQMLSKLSNGHNFPMGER